IKQKTVSDPLWNGRFSFNTGSATNCSVEIDYSCRDTGRLDALFKSDDTIHWENWSQVPLLTRHDIRRAGDALRSRELPPSHGEVWSYSSSGSTGESITVLHS